MMIPHLSCILGAASWLEVHCCISPVFSLGPVVRKPQVHPGGFFQEESPSSHLLRREKKDICHYSHAQ